MNNLDDIKDIHISEEKYEKEEFSNDDKVEQRGGKVKSIAKDIALCGLFAALIAVGAFLRIPIPVCPITFQTVFVLLGAVILGKWRATIASAVYVFTGFIGIPIFTQGGGLGYIFQPTCGYLFGFIIGSFIVGWLCEIIEKRKLQPKNKIIFISLACLLGILVIYAVGVPYLFAILKYYVHSKTATLWGAIYSGAIVCFPSDLFAVVIAVIAAIKVKPLLKKYL